MVLTVSKCGNGREPFAGYVCSLSNGRIGWDQVAEGIRHIGAEESFPRGISERTPAEEPRRSRIEIAVNLDVRSPIANVRRLNDKSAGQFPLDSKFPALHLSGFWIGTKGNCISDVCLKTSSVLQLLDAVWKWIRQRKLAKVKPLEPSVMNGVFWLNPVWFTSPRRWPR